MSIEDEINQYKAVAKLNNEFNAQEALKQREFEERLSSSAHQREVADLIKAGLNPVLSANAGASTPTGVSAQADTSVNSAMATSFASKRQTEAQLKAAQISANATMAAASAAAGAQMYAANKAAEASQNNAKLNAFAGVFNNWVTNAVNLTKSQYSSMWSLLWNAFSTADYTVGGSYNNMTLAAQSGLMMQNMAKYFGTPDMSKWNMSGLSNKEIQKILGI